MVFGHWLHWSEFLVPSHMLVISVLLLLYNCPAGADHLTLHPFIELFPVFSEIVHIIISSNTIICHYIHAPLFIQPFRQGIGTSLAASYFIPSDLLCLFWSLWGIYLVVASTAQRVCILWYLSGHMWFQILSQTGGTSSELHWQLFSMSIFWVQMKHQTLTCCVNLGKSLHPVCLSVLFCRIRIIMAPISQHCWKDQMKYL